MGARGSEFKGDRVAAEGDGVPKTDAAEGHPAAWAYFMPLNRPLDPGENDKLLASRNGEMPASHLELAQRKTFTNNAFLGKAHF